MIEAKRCRVRRSGDAVLLRDDPADDTRYIARCERPGCGREWSVNAARWRAHGITGCGCQSHTLRGVAAISQRHHMHGTPEHEAWCNLVTRHRRWLRDGRDAVRVCQRWQGFEAWIADVGTRPQGTSFERLKKGDVPAACGACEECSRNGWRRNGSWSVPRTERGASVRSSHAMEFAARLESDLRASLGRII
jgi:hypothetical protein